MKDFVLDICSHRGLHPITASCIEQLRMELGMTFVVKYDSGDAWLDRLRSVAATTFLRHDWAPYMIFLDDDIVFHPDDIKRIVNDLRSGYDLVGGTYSVRTGAQLASFGGEEGGRVSIDGNIQEIKWLATGFMGFSKKLLQDMVDQLKLPLLHEGQWCECYPFFIFKNDGNMLFSEDWEFCEKAKKVGRKVYMDTGVLVGHIGDKIYSIEDVVKATQQRELVERKKKGLITQEGAKAVIESTTQILEKMGVRYWLDSGTLLGAVRNNAINVLDHDVDIRCFKEDVPDDKMGLLMGELYQAGFTTLECNDGDRKQMLALHLAAKCMLDLKFCEHDDEHLWYYVWDFNRGSAIDGSEPAVHCFPMKFFDKLGSRKFLGRKYPVPSPEKEYLEFHYGEKWREFKLNPEDVDMTDLKWDSQNDPPCAMSIEDFKKLKG